MSHTTTHETGTGRSRAIALLPDDERAVIERALRAPGIIVQPAAVWLPIVFRLLDLLAAALAANDQLRALYRGQARRRAGRADA